MQSLGTKVNDLSCSCCFLSSVFQLLSEGCSRSFSANATLLQLDGSILFHFAIPQSLSGGSHLIFATAQKFVSWFNFHCWRGKVFLWVRSVSFFLFIKFTWEKKIGFQHNFWRTWCQRRFCEVLRIRWFFCWELKPWFGFDWKAVNWNFGVYFFLKEWIFGGWVTVQWGI